MRIPDQIRRELDACGRPYEVVCGKKHQKVFIDGQLVGMFSRNARKGTHAGRGAANLVAQIRRFVTMP